MEALANPLLHLLRNAVDHGIEPVAEREKSKKTKEGNIGLKAYHQGSHLILEISDDGGGMDPERILKKAIEKGLASPDDSLTKQQIYQFIFNPGFSTKEQVSDISGRGVGLDVVKTQVENVLQGTISIETEKTMGTTFRISVPLTLAIIDGMLVRCDRFRYIIPLNQIRETTRLQGDTVEETSQAGFTLNLRGETLPIYDLGSILGVVQRPGRPSGVSIIGQNGRKRFSVAVDEIVGQQQVVIKQLGKELRELNGISGGAVLGDGTVSLILDLNELIEKGNREAFKLAA